MNSDRDIIKTIILYPSYNFFIKIDIKMIFQTELNIVRVLQVIYLWFLKKLKKIKIREFFFLKKKYRIFFF